MTTIIMLLLVSLRKLPYMKVFEHFANNLWSHYMHETLHFSSDSIAPTTIICKSALLTILDVHSFPSYAPDYS